MKTCSSCNILQSKDNFNKQKLGKDGLRPNCRSCEKIYRENNKERIAKGKKEWYENNREHTIERVKKYISDNKEIISIKKKRYREDNKEIISVKNKQYRNGSNRNKLLFRKKQYRENNKEKVSKSLKEWYKNNVMYSKNARHKRRCLTKRGDVTTVQLTELKKQSTNCFHCGCELLNEFHIDHYIPLSRGGLHTISNLVISCKFCNLSKGNKMPEDFYKSRVLA